MAHIIQYKGISTGLVMMFKKNILVNKILRNFSAKYSSKGFRGTYLCQQYTKTILPARSRLTLSSSKVLVSLSFSFLVTGTVYGPCVSGDRISESAYVEQSKKR
jgi:hypothetical protein